MGSDHCNYIPSKPRYDITMSRRTRKPLMNLKEANQYPTTGSPEEESSSAVKDVVAHDDKGADNFVTKVCEREAEEHRKSSLKQLIMIKKESEVTKVLEEETRGAGDDENVESKLLSGSRNSLGQHFKGEEKQELQLVTRKQSNKGMEGAKLKGMMGRYVKVLSHLIRVKRDTHIKNGSMKRPHLRLPM